MGYELHLERVGPDGERLEIPLDEWIAAVEATDSVRIATGDVRARNPMTGEEIVIHAAEGAVDVYFPPRGWRRIVGGKGHWHRYFRWFGGRVSFKSGNEDLDDPEDPVRSSAARLCRLLGARVFGDDGEEYDWL